MKNKNNLVDWVAEAMLVYTLGVLIFCIWCLFS